MSAPAFTLRRLASGRPSAAMSCATDLLLSPLAAVLPPAHCKELLEDRHHSQYKAYLGALKGFDPAAPRTAEELVALADALHAPRAAPAAAAAAAAPSATASLCQAQLRALLAEWRLQPTAGAGSGPPPPAAGALARALGFVEKAVQELGDC